MGRSRGISRFPTWLDVDHSQSHAPVVQVDRGRTSCGSNRGRNTLQLHFAESPICVPITSMLIRRSVRILSPIGAAAGHAVAYPLPIVRLISFGGCSPASQEDAAIRALRKGGGACSSAAHQRIRVPRQKTTMSRVGETALTRDCDTVARATHGLLYVETCHRAASPDTYGANDERCSTSGNNPVYGDRICGPESDRCDVTSCCWWRSLSQTSLS